MERTKHKRLHTELSDPIVISSQSPAVTMTSNHAEKNLCSKLFRGGKSGQKIVLIFLGCDSFPHLPSILQFSLRSSPFLEVCSFAATLNRARREAVDKVSPLAPERSMYCIPDDSVRILPITDLPFLTYTPSVQRSS